MIDVEKLYFGIRYGNSKWNNAVNMTWPLCTMSIQKDLLIIKCGLLFFHKKFIFNRSNIISFDEYNAIISRGIIIRHNCISAPVFIVIFSRRRDKVMRFLKTWHSVLDYENRDIIS